MAKQGDTAITQTKQGDLSIKNNAQQPATVPTTTYSGGGGGGGGGGGYSRSSYSSKPTKADQEKTQATMKNLGDIYGRKKKDLEKQTQAGLDVINDKINANNALLKQQQIQLQRNIEWQPQQQKEQSTLSSLRGRMGNAILGSGAVDLMEGLNRIDDMADSQLINTYKQNSDNAYNNWFQANTELVGDYNEALNDADQKMSDLLNQYQAALNNVNPLAATTENITKASKAEGNLADSKAAVKDAKSALATAKANQKAITQKALNSLSGNVQAKYQSKADLASDAQNRYKQAKDTLADLKKSGNAKQIAAARTALQAAKNDYLAARDDKNNYLDTKISKTKYADKVLKAAKKLSSAQKSLKKANSSLSKSKSATNKEITVGEGTEKITIPNIQITPSAAFSKLLKNKMSNADVANPATMGYIRPDQADTHLGGARGAFDTATEANSAFKDNLYAYRDPRIRSAALAQSKQEAAASKAAEAANTKTGALTTKLNQAKNTNTNNANVSKLLSNNKASTSKSAIPIKSTINSAIKSMAKAASKKTSKSGVKKGALSKKKKTSSPGSVLASTKSKQAKNKNANNANINKALKKR